MYKKFEFDEDPYANIDPIAISLDRIEWNRDDLKDAKRELQNFMEDVEGLNRVALKIWGPWGSGKTWLLRLIQKLVKTDVLVIYTKIAKVEPTFSVFYHTFIESLMPNIREICKGIDKDENAGPTISGWIDFIKDEDLAHCLWHLYREDTYSRVSKRWLFGEKAPPKDLLDASLITTLDGDYKKYKVLEELIDLSRLAFQTPILIIDQLESATGKIAGQIGDVLRELLDEFYERFAIICAYTAEIEDEWYDFGYTEALERRIDYKIELKSLEKDYIPEFLRRHHALYRKKDIKITDELSPFTEDGIQRILEVMDPGAHYPGYILTNCRNLAREATNEDVKEIDKGFVDAHLSVLKHLTTGLGLYG